MRALSSRGRSLSANVALVATCAASCASTSSVRWDRPLARQSFSPATLVFVMQPGIVGSASTGNVGRNFVTLRGTVAGRIIAIVRERYPQADFAQDQPPLLSRARFQRAFTDGVLSAAEAWAAADAENRGATHLLVPTITEWKEMRTDDPIGALILPHNSITLALRLIQLEPPAVVGAVTFSNHARLTLNQPATRLLNDRFRNMVLGLISGGP